MNAQPLNRRRLPLGLLAILISLDVAVRLLEKRAVVGSLMDRQAALALSLMKQPWWWLGLALGPLQLWVWTAILARTEFSVAYPLSSLGYPLTMAAAWLVFGEHLSWQVWLGAGFMTMGAAIVGSGARLSMRSSEWTADTPGLAGTSSDAIQPSRRLNDGAMEIERVGVAPCEH